MSEPGRRQGEGLQDMGNALGECGGPGLTLGGLSPGTQRTALTASLLALCPLWFSVPRAGRPLVGSTKCWPR